MTHQIRSTLICSWLLLIAGAIETVHSVQPIMRRESDTESVLDEQGDTLEAPNKLSAEITEVHIDKSGPVAHHGEHGSYIEMPSGESGYDSSRVQQLLDDFEGDQTGSSVHKKKKDKKKKGKKGRAGKGKGPSTALSTDEWLCEGKEACKGDEKEIVNSYTTLKCRGEKACENMELKNDDGVTNVLVLCQGKEACKGMKLPAVATTWTVNCDDIVASSPCKDMDFGGAAKCPGLCPTTMADALVFWEAATVPVDTMTCMNKILCYDQLPITNKRNGAFKCQCVWRSEMQRDNPMCDDYNQCLKDQTLDAGYMAQAFKNIETAIFTNSQSGPGSLVQSGAKASTEQTSRDHPDCVDPPTAMVEEYECECWNTWKLTCGVGSDAECWRTFICGHEWVCESYQIRECAEAERYPRLFAMVEMNTSMKARAKEDSDVKRQTDSERSASLDDSLSGKRSC